MVERFEIGRGLTVPISGEPSAQIDSKETSRVGLVGADYVGMRPTVLVAQGDSVEQGQPVFEDKKTAGVLFSSPVSGRVVEINRGDKRLFQSLVIEREGSAVRRFASHDAAKIESLGRQRVVEQMVESGLWTSLRARPYGKIPSPQASPFALFVNAMDTNPLSVNPETVIQQRSEEFVAGLAAVAQLTDGKTYLCRKSGAKIPGETVNRIHVAEFDGPHPSGLVGTHMHFLSPVNAKRVNWHLNYQDVIAVGHLLLNGQLDASRVISLAGPGVTKPRMLKTTLGASIEQLVSGQLAGGAQRVISGSVLRGRTVQGNQAYLGRYDLQVSALLEGTEREFMGWQMPGSNKFSVTKAFLSAWLAPKKFALTTSTGGSERAMVPIGVYEKVMPLDLIPTLLLRSLISRDTGTAQELGCLELDEEDLALCTFVCPGKYDYGGILRDNLTRIEKEG